MFILANFKEKDDLFIYICREKLSLFKQTLKEYDELNNYILAYEFFGFFKEQRNFIKSLTLNSTQILTSQAEIYIMEIVKESNTMPVLNNNENLQKYEWIFMVGGLLNMAIHWLNTDCVESSEEMAKVFTTMVKFQ